MKLYELTEQYLELQAMLEDETEDTEIIIDTIEAIEGDIECKAENYAKLIKTLEKEAEAIKEEEKRLAERRLTYENRALRLKKSLETAMIITDNKKFRTNLFSFNIQKNPPAVCIIGDVPEQYLIPQEPKVDKKQLIDYLKNNGNTEYAVLQQTESLRIK